MTSMGDPANSKIQQKISEALSILIDLGYPRQQKNDRSALTLLALLGLRPDDEWKDVQKPLMGITPIMNFIKEHYRLEYAPNTRETIRRQTMHQFVNAGLALSNPDKPDRPVNSPHWVYQIEEQAFKLLETYGSQQWLENLKSYLAVRETLIQQYARARKMHLVPVQISDKIQINLYPGKHSELIRAIIEEFGARFAPGGEVLYVGDTKDKWGYFDRKALKNLGVEVDQHGKMPDAVIYFTEKNWLLLIEAVTSHGPVDGKRRVELAKLFEQCTAGLIYVTAFLTRSDMARYISDISWETEVWTAESPTHLIHFDGERFLGPYET